MSEEEDKQKEQKQFIQPLFQDAFQKNLIRDILSPDDILEFLYNTLMGYRLNEEGSWVKDPFAKAIKKKAIYLTLQVLRGHLNKYQTLANLEKDDVLRMARTMRLEIINTIFQNWEYFRYVDDNSEDPDIGCCDYIKDVVDHNVFSNLTRAKDGREGQLLRTVYRSQDTLGSVERLTEKNQSSGFWSNLFKKKENINQEMR